MVPSTQPSTCNICASVHVGCWECFPLLSIYDPILKCLSMHSEINEVWGTEIIPERLLNRTLLSQTLIELQCLQFGKTA